MAHARRVKGKTYKTDPAVLDEWNSLNGCHLEIFVLSRTLKISRQYILLQTDKHSQVQNKNKETKKHLSFDTSV